MTFIMGFKVQLSELIAKNLRTHLLKHGSKAELSRKTGISRATIDDYLKGAPNKTLDNLGNIAEALGLPSDSLFKSSPSSGDARTEEATRILHTLSDFEWKHVFIVLRGLRPPMKKQDKEQA